jgi:hypothetical protein
MPKVYENGRGEWIRTTDFTVPKHETKGRNRLTPFIEDYQDASGRASSHHRGLVSLLRPPKHPIERQAMRNLISHQTAI